MKRSWSADAGLEQQAPVLIAGGGLVGLSAAAFLASHGIRSLTIERLATSSPLPRAAFFHMRTLEMFRYLGIEDAVRSQSAQEFVPEGAIIAMETLAGRKLADIIPNLNEGVDALSPCRRLFLNQPTLEPILRGCARAGGASIVQGAEIIDVHQDSDGVRLTIRKAGSPSTHELRGASARRWRSRPNPSRVGHRVRRSRHVFQLVDDLFHRGPLPVYSR